jgi:copper homeostasis protein
MNKPIQLEVCAFNIQSCLIAERAGAVRVELCDNPVEGGTTPSYGTIRQVREKTGIQLFPIIRPRCNHYWYDDDEWEIIQKDIALCRELGCDGISIGFQKKNGEIDTGRLAKAVELAYPMKVTCNRAFDAAPDPVEALEAVIAAGCARILTSGQASTAPDGSALLAQLVRLASDRISVMPGAGVKSSNLAQLIAATGAHEYHASARVPAPVTIQYLNPAITDSGTVVIAGEQELKAMVAIMRQHTRG